MTEFEQSEWKDIKQVHEFVENADNYILERNRQFKILRSFYNHYLQKKSDKNSLRVLDLGSGSGRVTAEILEIDGNAELYLVDGSTEMIETAKSHLKYGKNIHFINKTFQDLIKSNNFPFDFDLIISALAIHHLSTEEKDSLFKYIYDRLVDGGFFINMEVVLPLSESLEEWYLSLWQDWIQENEIKQGLEESFQHIPLKYKNNPDNHPDTLEYQLDTLKRIGFKNVDCHYKYGIFSMYSGEK
jgi:tRNA (cmo5U34)-methyltransferase